MNKFFRFLQPTIIQATMNEELPPEVRGRYFINFNVFGIQYFTEKYILQETDFGAAYLILKEDNWGFQLEDTDEGELIDIPRIYIDITEEFVHDEHEVFSSFVAQSLMDNVTWITGIDNFIGGQQYYVNKTLYNALALTDSLPESHFEVRLPNYLDNYGQIQTKYWKDLSGEPYQDYTNLEYFMEKNNLVNNEYPIDDLNNFYSTFCSIILEYSKISDELLAEGNNPIYNLVLNYYKNFKSDCGSNAIDMILNTGYTTVDNKTQVGCGCNSTDTTSTDITPGCSELYRQAMETWLKKMLSDYKFYEDWFRIYKNDKEYIPNDVLIERIQTLFTEFFLLQHSLTFLPKNYRHGCDCPAPVTFDEDECNYNIMKNYLKIMDWVFDDELDANINKIKIYGGQFAELLPYLQF